MINSTYQTRVTFILTSDLALELEGTDQREIIVLYLDHRTPTPHKAPHEAPSHSNTLTPFIMTKYMIIISIRTNP